MIRPAPVLLGLVLLLSLPGCRDRRPSSSRRAVEAYLKHSRTQEARRNLLAIALGCRTAFDTERIDRSGQVLPRTFPAAGPTPARIPCRRERVPAPVWEKDGWHAVRFAPEDPLHFQYRLVSAGEGDGATFTARAHADLDCDGKASTFEVTGRVVRGEVVIGPLTVKDERE